MYFSLQSKVDVTMTTREIHAASMMIMVVPGVGMMMDMIDHQEEMRAELGKGTMSCMENLGSLLDSCRVLFSPEMIVMVVAVLGVGAPRQPPPLPHEPRCLPLASSRDRGRERRAGRWLVGNASPRRCQ